MMALLQISRHVIAVWIQYQIFYSPAATPKVQEKLINSYLYMHLNSQARTPNRMQSILQFFLFR